MSLLFDGASLEVQDAALVGWFLCAELLPNLVHVLRVNVIIHAGPKPVTLKWCWFEDE